MKLSIMDQREVSSKKFHFNFDSDDSNCSPNSDSDCDPDIEMKSTSSASSSPSLPVCHGNNLAVIGNRSLTSPLIADYTSCSHCANSSSSSTFGDSHNKRLCFAKKVVSVIRKGKFDEFVNLLHSTPNLDLNTFVNGNTALHYCLLFGRDVSWCKQLVSKGANANLCNIDGWHPIHLAACGQNQDILAYLLKCNSRQIVPFINADCTLQFQV